MALFLIYAGFVILNFALMASDVRPLFSAFAAGFATAGLIGSVILYYSEEP